MWQLQFLGRCVVLKSEMQNRTARGQQREKSARIEGMGEETETMYGLDMEGRVAVIRHTILSMSQARGRFQGINCFDKGGGEPC